MIYESTSTSAPQTRTRIGNDYVTSAATSVRDPAIHIDSDVSIVTPFKSSVDLLCCTPSDQQH